MYTDISIYVYYYFSRWVATRKGIIDTCLATFLYAVYTFILSILYLLLLLYSLEYIINNSFKYHIYVKCICMCIE